LIVANQFFKASAGCFEVAAAGDVVADKPVKGFVEPVNLLCGAIGLPVSGLTGTGVEVVYHSDYLSNPIAIQCRAGEHTRLPPRRGLGKQAQRMTEISLSSRRTSNVVTICFRDNERVGH